MKSSRTFFIGIGIAAVLIFVLQLRVPQRFSWRPSFSPHDRQPFGCYVFDSVMRHSLAGDYQVVHKTLRQLNNEKEYEKRNILIVSTGMNLGDVDLNNLDSLLQKGARVMIAYGPQYIEDSVLYKRYGIAIDGYYRFDVNILKRTFKETRQIPDDTIRWNSSVHFYQSSFYPVYSQMVSATVTGGRVMANILHRFDERTEDRTVVEVEGVDGAEETVDTLSVLTSVRRGKGELIVMTTPLVLTNYGILDDNLSPYAHRLMTLIADCPVIRTTAYMETSEMEEARQSPFRYLLSQRPLKWALWLSLLLIALFMVFTARRRQRVIPVEDPPRNHTLEFIGLIGTLYYQQRDHADLLQKKWGYFAEELRSRLDLDIADAQDDNTSAEALARRTGMDKLETATLLRDVRQVLQTRDVTDRQLQLLIRKMNEILRKL